VEKRFYQHLDTVE